jgi:hypothetical protein
MHNAAVVRFAEFVAVKYIFIELTFFSVPFKRRVDIYSQIIQVKRFISSGLNEWLTEKNYKLYK